MFILSKKDKALARATYHSICYLQTLRNLQAQRKYSSKTAPILRLAESLIFADTLSQQFAYRAHVGTYVKTTWGNQEKYPGIPRATRSFVYTYLRVTQRNILVVVRFTHVYQVDMPKWHGICYQNTRLRRDQAHSRCFIEHVRHNCLGNPKQYPRNNLATARYV